VTPSALLPWLELDWRDHAEDERVPRLQQLLREDRQTDFDFERAPLMRFTLIRVAPNEHDFLWTHHHILMDGWCLPILLKEVLTWYHAIRGTEAPSFELPVPYRRYIAWQQQQDPVAAEQFWRATLKGFTVPTAIGEDRKADASDEDGSHGIETLTLSAAETAAMQAYARHHHVTLNTLVQGAWALLLSRYSGETDIVFGTTVSGRSADIPGIETIIGLFINTLPLRMPVPPDAIVHRWLRDLLERNSDLRQYEQTPLANIQGWSEVPRGRSLFDSLIVFDNHPMDETVERDPSELVVEDMTLQGQTNYPLTLNVLPGEELTVAFWYQRRRFTQESMFRIVRHFKTLLRSTLENPAARIGELSMMGAAERATVVTQWNATERIYPTDRTVPELIAAQAEATPAAIAVRDAAGTLTYGELLARANQVAQALRAQGVGPETFVGIAMERSLDLVVGLLGILQAGAAYVPLDPSYPTERLAYMLADSQVAALVTHEALVTWLAFTGPTLCLDRDWPAIARFPATAPPGRFTAEQLAYVIYTSGSTGQPKGAGNSHGGLRNRLQWMQEAYPLTAADRVLQKTPISFDVSVWEFFWPLTVGAELIMAAPDEHKEPAKLIARIVTQGVTTLHFVPPMLQAFLATPGVERCRSLRHLICSGEALPATLPPQVQALLPTVALHNLYGPTEAAIDVTAWTCPQSPAVTAVPIGRPIANLQIYLLDPQGQPVPVGVPGELYIGGAGVARGYHRRPALTAARFVPDPFSATPGQRLYRTGDVVRYRADGAIEYLGRLDHQVKIRGFRIELGEIEQTLGQQPGIREAVVVARREASGSTRLVAYVTAQAGQGLDPLALRQALGRTLPDYMVPAVILPLAELPLSPNGKVDRKALPAPEAEAQRTAAYVAPENDTEQRLAAIWSQVLGLPRVGRQDNFFELGGDSINSLQILARAHQEGIKLTPKQLFDHPTIASVAAVAVIGNIDQAESASDMADPSRIADVELTDDEMQNLLEEIG
jgi:amino acid adenylation domain-containing protein